MNILKIANRFAGKTVILGLALAILGGCGEDTTLNFNRATGVTERHTTPDDAKLDMVRVHDVGEGEVELEIKLRTYAPFRGKDTITFVAQFVPEMPGYADHKSIVMKIPPGSLRPNSRQVAMASLVNLDRESVERERPVLLYGNTLRVKFPASDLTNLNGFYARSYFRPDKLEEGATGPNGILATVVAITTSIFANIEEDIIEQTMVDDDEMTAFLAGLSVDTSGWRRLNFPRGSTCPPRRTNPTTPMDFDNDPSTKEGLYNGSETQLPGGKTSAILYILAPPPGQEPDGGNSWFQPIVYIDREVPENASEEEICAATTDLVGQCMYPRGMNSWHIDTNTGYLQWISRDIDESGNQIGQIRFEYDPATGNLKTFDDDNENPSYDGPADDWGWSYRFDGTGCTSEEEEEEEGDDEEALDGVER
jgi:hypothetical protein